ncbi:CoA ester lyase [Paraburkholderia sp.]|uniref:HpcH/HpaI aldolase/citrate lyase family protein n=1 Tax=Paraburkholderia sp. TaxID=1926495 RepID=UPI00286F8A3E|nr:CoA ester lyase [Paraburkholderia sp.]
MNAPRVTRTVLAVPGHRENMLQSAAASEADAVFIDLEDAVPLDKKREALDGAVHALNTLDWGGKWVSVRINTSAHGIAVHEVETLVRDAAWLDAVLVPKVENIATVHEVERLLRARPAKLAPIAIEALIETARGLVCVDDIAASSERLVALHFGVGDFAASIGARTVEIGGTHAGYAHTLKNEVGNYDTSALDLWAYPMMRLLVAARAFGLRAIDGPCGAFRDAVLTRAWALKAAAMGYDGKQVIHPSQIAPTRAAFSPTDNEVRDARRTIEALEEAQAAGLAAVSLDGKLVDFANVRMAQRVLAMAGA